MTISFAPPEPPPGGSPAYLAARCQVLHNDNVIGYFERHDFGNGRWPVSGSLALDLEEIPPSSCYVFRDLRGMTQFASGDREAMIKRIEKWARK